MFRTLIFIWCLCLSVGVSAGIAANNSPLIGYKELCANKPTLPVCRADKQTTQASLPHPLPGDMRRQLQVINEYWNAKIQPKTDLDKYQRAEFWNADVDEGDCEEYQLAKKSDLLKLGFTASQLLLAVVLQTSGEGHLVLIVRTQGANLVLDNLTNDIVKVEDMPYTLVKHQSPDDPDAIWTTFN